MHSETRQGSAGHVYRVDKFVVPASARDEFLSRVKATHEVLRKQRGFVRDSLLEQVSGPGEFNFVTVAEWESEAHIEGARTAVAAMHRQSHFDPQEMLRRLRIKADVAYYRRLDG